MKAPDKIHLFFSSDGDYLAFKEPPFEGTVAYIRKGALLELLKAIREDLYNWHFHKEQECWKTYDEIIDKLNKM